jgi:hypothetical protein
MHLLIEEGMADGNVSDEFAQMLLNAIAAEDDEDGNMAERTNVHGRLANLRPDRWAAPRKDRYQWLIDCYRLRVEDDAKEGEMHGLADPQSSTVMVVSDFFYFCKLAVKHYAIPDDTSIGGQWDWGAFLQCAQGAILKRLDRASALKMYGVKNVQARSTTGTGFSLQQIADEIYSPYNDTLELHSLDEEIDKEIREALIGTDNYAFPDGYSEALFADVGGKQIWIELMAGIGECEVIDV